MTLTKKHQDDSWNIALLGILFILAVLFFHWRENKQEEVMRKVVETLDNENVDSPGIKQRLNKLEKADEQAAAAGRVEVPQKVRQRRYNRTKKLNMIYAQPNFRNEVIK